MALVQRICLWCGSTYNSKRSTSKCCSAKCNNEMNYVRARDWDNMPPDEFAQVITGWMEVHNLHPNPNHPLSVADKALADFYQSVNNLLETTIELHKQQEGILNA